MTSFFLKYLRSKIIKCLSKRSLALTRVEICFQFVQPKQQELPLVKSAIIAAYLFNNIEKSEDSAAGLQQHGAGRYGDR